MKNISKVIFKETKICLKFEDRQKISVQCFSSRINIHRIYFIMNLVKHSKGWSLEEREEIQIIQL